MVFYSDNKLGGGGGGSRLPSLFQYKILTLFLNKAIVHTNEDRTVVCEDVCNWLCDKTRLLKVTCHSH